MSEGRRTGDDIFYQMQGTIGELKADCETAREDRAEMKIDVKEILAQLTPLSTIPARVIALEKEVSDTKMLKQRGIGILAGLGIAGGAAGASLKHAFDLMFGIGAPPH